MCDLADIIYFSSRKISCTRGGGIATKSKDLYLARCATWCRCSRAS